MGDDTMNHEGDDAGYDMGRLVEEALASEDDAWLVAERELLEAAASGSLQPEAIEHDDPFGKMVAESMARAPAGADADLRKVTQYFDYAGRYFAKTPARTPPIRGLIANLTATYGPRLTELLAMRLAQQRRMPSWQAVTTLGYLAAHPNPRVAPAVVRYAARSRAGRPQSLAIRLLRSMDRTAVAAAIRSERRRHRGQLPAALAALAGSASSRTA